MQWVTTWAKRRVSWCPCLLVAFYQVVRQFARIASLFKFEIPGEFPQHSESINARAKPIAFGSVNVFPSSAK